MLLRTQTSYDCCCKENIFKFSSVSAKINDWKTDSWRIQPFWLIQWPSNGLYGKVSLLCGPEVLMVLYVVQQSFLSTELQQMANLTAHGCASNKLLWLTLPGIIVCLWCEDKEKMPVCCSQLATQLSPSCCHKCLTNRSVRGYEKSPQYYFLLLKCASVFHLHSHLTIMKGYTIPSRMAALNKRNDLFLFVFLFQEKWSE